MKDHPGLFIAGIVVALTVILPIFWCSVVWLISRLSGWSLLARAYESNRAFEGRRHTGQSARLGWVNYNRTLAFTVMEDGLGIAILPLFSAGHPNLLIPWCKLRRTGARRWLFKNYDVYHITEPSTTRLVLPAGIIEESRLDGPRHGQDRTAVS